MPASPPPPLDQPARRWVEGSLGRSWRISDEEVLRGGITSWVQAVRVEGPGGRVRDLVLRRYEPGGEADPLPDLVALEARALEALAQAGVADVPRLVASDPAGSVAGLPALLMTRLPGRPTAPAGPGPDALRWADGLADGAAEVLGALRMVDPGPLPPWAPWRFPQDPPPEAPPPWARQPAAWAVLAGVLDRSRSSGAPLQAIHRDLNPGNLLWEHGRITGAVDWLHLAHGPIEVDLSRCRLNVWLIAGSAAADRFLDRARANGLAYDPTWDLETLAETAPFVDQLMGANGFGARLSPELARERFEEVVVAAAVRTAG